MHSLYTRLITKKIEEKQLELSEKQDLLFPYLEDINKYKHILSAHFNITHLLEGKVNVFTPTDESSEQKYLAILVRNYHSIKQNIIVLENSIKALENKMVSFQVYKAVISIYNREIINFMITTGKSFNNKYLGALTFFLKENVSNVVDWGASNANKKKILDAGLTPYLKKDEEAALKKGIPYDGLKWLVKGKPRPMITLRWRITSQLREICTRGIYGLKYDPSRGNDSISSLLIKFNKNTDNDFSIFTKL